MPPVTDTLDLPQLITEVIAEVQAAADAKGVHVAASDLARMPRWVEADDAALRRILHNTLDLVVGTASAGTITVRLDVLDANRDRWTCRVEWQGDDGDVIDVIDEVRCEFVATLPPGLPADAGRSLRVLVVDDSAQHRSIVGAYLSGTAHQCLEAAGGAEALERITAEPFDVVLMDLQMPEMGGLAAIEALREIEDTSGHPRSYVIALTAMAAEDDAAAAEAAGADLCLAKPVGRSALFKALATIPPSAHPPISPPAQPPTQMLSVARHQLTAILMAEPSTQVERFRVIGQVLKTTARDAGLGDIGHLAEALERAAETGDLRHSQTAARTVIAWMAKMQS